MGVTRSGRWAALTNYRDPPTARPGRPSRGALVGDFLRGSEAPEVYLAAVAADAEQYDGFNLLVGDLASAHYFGNRVSGGPAPARAGGVWPQLGALRAACMLALIRYNAPS
jgi:uncharacterized protein with NRDE domain